MLNKLKVRSHKKWQREQVVLFIWSINSSPPAWTGWPWLDLPVVMSVWSDTAGGYKCWASLVRTNEDHIYNDTIIMTDTPTLVTQTKQNKSCRTARLMTVQKTISFNNDSESQCNRTTSPTMPETHLEIPLERARGRCWGKGHLGCTGDPVAMVMWQKK